MVIQKWKPPGGKPGGERVGEHEVKLQRHFVEPTRARQGRRLPAYGRELAAAQSNGLNVPFLILSLVWNYGRALPRVVIPDDLHVDDLDLRIVAGLDCMVVHHDQHARAFDVAELALASGATRCPAFDMATGKTTYTEEVLLARRVAA